MRHLKSLFKRIPFEYYISIIYLIIGCLWILFSDKVAERLTPNEQTLTHIQHYKGWFYVFITAVFLLLFSKKHYEKLRHAEGIAKENEKLKTAFIENISHELRTPMNAIIGFTEIAQTEGTNKEEMKEYLSIILKSSKQLLSVVNDVMDTSLLESGHSHVFIERIALKPFISGIQDYFTPIMKDRVVLNIHTEESDIVFYTDKEKLTRVFHNLINNAIKFTHHGRIDIGYQVIDHTIIFFVKDTGIGIKPSLHQSIFERFKQAEVELANRTGGTGLGLSICKEMLNLIGGKIWIESEPGTGSNFFFSIPFKQQEDH